MPKYLVTRIKTTEVMVEAEDRVEAILRAYEKDDWSDEALEVDVEVVE